VSAEPGHALARELRAVLESGEARLRALTEEASARRPAPGQWSPREVVGHLIDSAANNHARFVRAQLADDLVFPGYEQDAWIAVEHFQDAEWSALQGLWSAYNRHLAHVMEHADREALLRPRARHNLHEIGWAPVAESEPVTLEWFMRDYVGHLAHHLDQV